MPANSASSKVWDPIVRLGHWSLAAFFAAAYWTGGDWLDLHAHLGYCVGLLVLLRLYWGCVGPTPARFSSFVRPFADVRAFLYSLFKRSVLPHSGHDPAGGWMIVALLVALAVTAASGTVLFALEGRGPLAGSFVMSWPGATVEAVHHLASDISLVLICVHILGVLAVSWLTRQNLIGAMIKTDNARGTP
ncbi:MAG: cytochrome b/b6 domain-containing protein [Pseudomonadales bacterium]